jgi:hypothetical protein
VAYVDGGVVSVTGLGSLTGEQVPGVIIFTNTKAGMGVEPCR